MTAPNAPSPSGRGQGEGLPGNHRLRLAFARLRRPTRPPLDLRPTNPFELQIAERLKALEAELDQLRSRLNWLLTLIVGAAATNIAIALIK